MKALIISACLFIFASLSGAQLLDLPSCAQNCAQNLPPECGISVQCICSNVDWITNISCCVKKTCSDDDQQKTIKLATDLCKTAKVTLPQAASCAASDSSTSATTSQSSSNASTSIGSAATSSAASSSSSTTTASKSGTITTGSSNSQSTTRPSSSTGTAATTSASAPHIRPGAAVAGVVVGALALL